MKPSNCILNANCDLKVCDFWLALITSETDIVTEYVVTCWFCAPELILIYSEYKSTVDIWSVNSFFIYSEYKSTVWSMDSFFYRDTKVGALVLW